MADGVVRLRKGERAPLYGAVSAASGATVTIASASYTLYGSDGSVKATGSASGYDSGALSTARAWVTLDTSSLSAGTYTLVFSITLTGSDSITRLREPSALVVVCGSSE